MFEVEDTNLFTAAAAGFVEMGVSGITSIVIESPAVNFIFRLNTPHRLQRLADEFLRASQFAAFEVEETNREGDIFYYIDPESNVLEVTLDGLVVRQTEDL